MVSSGRIFDGRFAAHRVPKHCNSAHYAVYFATEVAVPAFELGCTK